MFRHEHDNVKSWIEVEETDGEHRSDLDQVCNRKYLKHEEEKKRQIIRRFQLLLIHSGLGTVMT